MTKILSRSGASLADIYDVEGSIAGIEQLETRELPIVHEMGATVLSERFTTRVFRIPTGAISQSTAFNVELTTLPERPCRLLGIQVITNDATRLARIAVLATDPTLGQDIPLWVWDSVAAASELVTMEDAGGAFTVSILVPRTGLNIFPAFVGGQNQQDTMVSSITFAGLTTAFGAGDSTNTALMLLAFARSDGSRPGPAGVPVPSW